MYVLPNAQATDAAVVDALANLKSGFVAESASRIRFGFMRLDRSAEPEFAKILKLEGDEPKIVVMNAGKRKRFLHHEGDMTADALQGTLQKILDGEGRFKTVKGNKLPPLVSA